MKSPSREWSFQESQLFTGIVECISQVSSVKRDGSHLHIVIDKPRDFNDLQVGHSVAVNGVCLTLEVIDEKSMRFTLAAETLQLTGWTEDELRNKRVNLERALKVNDRLHGHLVSGHVENRAKVLESPQENNDWKLRVELPESSKPFCFKKSGITIDGVGLTINEIDNQQMEVGLIPETLKVTTLGQLQPGDEVNLESDYFVKAIVNSGAKL